MYFNAKYSPFKQKNHINVVSGGGAPLLLKKEIKERFQLQPEDVPVVSGNGFKPRIGSYVAGMHNIVPYVDRTERDMRGTSNPSVNGGSFKGGAIPPFRMPTSLMKKNKKKLNNIRLDFN